MAEKILLRPFSMVTAQTGGKTMKNSATKSINQWWDKTKVQNLGRHKSSRYYARAFGNKKEIWKSLRSENLSVAKARLAQFLREYHEKQVAVVNHPSAKMTLAEAFAIICKTSTTTSR